MLTSGTDGKPRRDAADGAVDSWAEAVAATQVRGVASTGHEHLRYVVDVQERFYVPAFTLEAHMVPVLKSGLHGAARSFPIHGLAAGSAKQILPIDRTIGRLINASGLVGGLGSNVSPIVLGTLLEVLIRTERLHWRSLRGPTLHREALDDVRFSWSVDEDGRQRLHLDERPSTRLIGAIPLWYVDAEHALAGPARTTLDPTVAALLAAAPALTPEQAKRAQSALRHVFVAVGIDGPAAEIDVRTLDDRPTPSMRLNVRDGAAVADLEFVYAEPASPRRAAFENAAFARLQELGFEREQMVLRFPQPEELRWLRFLGSGAAVLRADGWRVEIDDDFPYTIVEPDDVWHAELTPGEHSWFELDLGIDVAGGRIPLLPILVDALGKNGIGSADDLGALATRSEPVYGKLPNGTYVALPAERIARVLATLVDLFDGAAALTEGGRLPIAPMQAASLKHLEGAAEVLWSKARELEDLLAALDGIERRPIDVPTTFHAELRPYQRDGVAWLQALREYGFGGVLADDMGLGKTVQLLAHVAIEKAAGRLHAPVLIVAPTSVVPNWRSEIVRFTPELNVVSLTGADRAERFGSIDDFDVVLTTYALLPRDAEQLVARRWSIVVLDEAQAIKNPRVKAALAATRLQADQRIAMTGTPIQNHLEDLWSMYAFAVPGLLGERSRFARLFRTPIEKRGDTLRRNALAARIRPFFLRRTKDRVASELPEKTEIVQRVELAGAQRDFYETIRLAMHKRVRDEVSRRGLARSRIVVLDALLKLRQICCDPRLVKLPAAAGVKESQKLDALLEMLESLIEDGRRVLLFSQFTSMLDLIKPELEKRELAFVELRGDTRDRETPVLRFQGLQVPLFLISLKAGGTGLNLTAADTVIHYDPWWNPAVERQATDRAHRIGQEQHVFVYKLIAEDTVEERILELQQRKATLAASLFDEATTAPLRLELDDIERLFA
ncbi:MAG TPA: DEAD/DEAH box helicase [Candidatus Baltobacteraceae bacterium]